MRINTEKEISDILTIGIAQIKVANIAADRGTAYPFRGNGYTPKAMRNIEMNIPAASGQTG